MAFATFQGPLRAGTKPNGSLAQGRNAGLVVLDQHWDSGDLTGDVVGNNDSGVVMNIPKGATIVDIVVDQVVAAGTGTVTVQVGTSAGGSDLMAAVATTAGGRFRGTATATTQLAWNDGLGAADTAIHVRWVVGTATLTAGRFIVHVVYVQRAENQAAHPNP